jgi:type I restriction enzyme S subunit
MTNKWQSKAFDDCIKPVKYTCKIQRKDFLDSGQFPIISQEAKFINGYWDDKADVFKVSTPVVIFGDHTQVLKYVDFDFVLGADGVKILQPRDFLHPKFFFHQLQAANLSSLGYARHYRLLKKLNIKYPPLSEQQRIIGVLDEAFEGLATATANAEKNLQNARALFESHLRSVFTQRGPGWVEMSVGALVSDGILAAPIDGNHGEIHPKKADFLPSGVPFIMASDLENGGVNQQECAFISRKQADSLRKGFAKNGDVLLSHKGTIGRVAILHTDHDYVMLTPQVTYYRVTAPEKLLNRFVYYALQAPEFVQAMNEIAGAGSTRAYIGILKQQELPFAFPDISEQRLLADQLDALSEDTHRLAAIYEQKLAALEALKKSLLHQAFSGNL